MRNFKAIIDPGGVAEPIGQRLQESGRELIRHWNRLHPEEIERSTF